MRSIEIPKQSQLTFKHEIATLPASQVARNDILKIKKSFIHSGTKDTWRSAVPPEFVACLMSGLT